MTELNSITIFGEEEHSSNKRLIKEMLENNRININGKSLNTKAAINILSKDNAPLS